MPTEKQSRVNRRVALKQMAAGVAVSPFIAGCGKRQSTAPGSPKHTLIKNGQVYLDGATSSLDILIFEEKITKIEANLSAQVDAQVIDATGKTVLPGGIDPHVHLTPPWVDDFYSGSRAALAGGITTVGNISFPDRNERLVDTISRFDKQVSSNAIADVIIHPVINNPEAIDLKDIALLSGAGCKSIKFFLLNSDFASQREHYLNLLRVCAREGIVAMFHCEDRALLEKARVQLVQQGKTSIKYFAESRPVESEVEATRRAIDLCRESAATVYIVHLSSAKALELCKKAQLAGLPLHVETRPLYLHFTDEVYDRDDGPLWVGMPPIRSAADQDALWQGIADGSISTIGSDHAPWTRAQKMDPQLTIENPRAGVNNLQYMLPMLYSEGVVKNRISLKQFVDVTSANAARIFGLENRKGVIKVGADADLVIWDPAVKYRIDQKACLSKAGFSIYDGFEVTGRPEITLRRGEVVFSNLQVTGKRGSGKALGRK